MYCFDKDRAIHSLKVAEFMRDYAKLLNLDEDDAWLVGYLHDIGYIYDKKNHGLNATILLNKHNFELAKYCELHDSNEEIKDNMEFLLRLADCVINETGSPVGINDRLRSIIVRNPYVDTERINKKAYFLKEYADKNMLSELLKKFW